MTMHSHDESSMRRQERRKLQRYLCNDGFTGCKIRLLLDHSAGSEVNDDVYGPPIAVTLTNFNHQGLGFFHHEPVDISRFADTDRARQAPHALFDLDFLGSSSGDDAAVHMIPLRDLPAQFVYVTDSDVGTNYGLKFVQASSSTAESQRVALITIENELARISSLERYNLD